MVINLIYMLEIISETALQNTTCCNPKKMNIYTTFIKDRQYYFLALVIALCLATPKAFSQETSAGSILQGIKSQEPTAILPQPEPKLELNKPPQGEPSGNAFTITQIHFMGNTQVSLKKLQSLTASFLNHPITFRELKYATDVIAQYYREQGWIVRVILPEQDISNGIVTIQIIEASFGGLLIDNQSKRVSNARVQAWICQQIPQGSSLSLAALDRALLTLNDQPDIAVAGALQEGSKPGETIVFLTVTDKPLVDGVVAVDNFGQTATGQNRGTANLNINSPLGLGEQVNVFGLYTEGSSYGRVAVTAPVGDSGLRAGLNGSFLSYRVINPSFNQLWANGSSSTGGAEVSYPIIRSRPANLYAFGNYNYSSFTNYANGGTTSQYSTSVLLGGLAGNFLDSFAGGGINSGSLLFSGGKVNLNASPSFQTDVIGPQVNGNFTKLRYAANRLQAVVENLSLFIGFSGQLANKNLDSSEQLYLGGPYAVRAYATGQGNASQGNLSTIELRQTLPLNLLLTGFYDYANVQTFKNTNFAGSPTNNTYVLQGLGASLAWMGPLGFQVKGIWAMRTGTLPASITQSLSGSGGTSSNRFWLTASLPF